MVESHLRPLSNDAALISIAEEEITSTLRKLVCTLSLRADTTCYGLYGIPLNEFHRVITTATSRLLNYFAERQTESFSLCAGNTKVTLSVPVNFDESVFPRTAYDVIVVLVPQTQQAEEYVAAGIYIVHLRHNEEDRVATQLLYTFWKTNRNRLVDGKVLFSAASHPDTEQEIPISRTSLPACTICLTEGAADRIFLPCRHVAVCGNCVRTFWATSSREAFFVPCPVCRNPVVSIRRI